MSGRARIALIVGGLAGAVVVALWATGDGDETDADDVAGQGDLPGVRASDRPGFSSPAFVAAVDAGRATVEEELLEEPGRVDRGVAIGVGATAVATGDPAGEERPPQTTGWRLGQTRRILGYMQDRLPLIEEAIAEAERTGDTERAQLERRRLAQSHERIARLEAHATELEQEATADGTLADAEQTGPARVTVDRRPGEESASEQGR